MTTLRLLSAKSETIPLSVAWALADLGEARGKQELFIRQRPQSLKVLREHAIIESAISSNRIEGVEVDEKRIKAILFGKAHLRDRDEEEVRGYRNALKLIHEQGGRLAVSEDTAKRLHRLCHAEMGDAGKYKTKDSDIIEKYPDGRVRVRFRTVPAAKTAKYMRDLIESWDSCLEERSCQPLVALAAFNLDFLCVHPFRDGNGRVSRLLMLLQCYHLGFEVGRYISIERLIEQNKERYYETLEQSSHGWHNGKHNPWPYINYLLFILKTAYKEFETRFGQTTEPKGAKTVFIEEAIRKFDHEFSLADMERACPGISHDMVRKVLRDFQRDRKVECLGRGPGAKWRRRGITPKRG